MPNPLSTSRADVQQIRTSFQSLNRMGLKEVHYDGSILFQAGVDQIKTYLRLKRVEVTTEGRTQATEFASRDLQKKYLAEQLLLLSL